MDEKSNPMNISPTEAEEALAAIQTMTQKTRHSIASSGAYISLIVTGVVWLVGFLCHPVPVRRDRRIYLDRDEPPGQPVGAPCWAPGWASASAARRQPPMAKRIGLFWLLLVFYAIATIAIARPTDGKQVTMFIILFIMIGQLAMGLLLSFSSVWWALPITALALAGYFLLPGIFYLWMAILGGGGMIALGLYIRSRW